MIPIANPELSADAKERVDAVLDSGMLADGDQVREFEDEFAAYCGAEQAVATSNGTTALHAALEALGIGEGDRVLTTPFSFVATANPIRLVGAEPVFADIDPETYNLDPAAAREVAREEEVDAIVVVHLYGLPAEMDAFIDLAEDLDVPLIEDAAQAHGATYDGQRVGSIGDVGCFSFYPTKNMTTGEGGMVTTDDPAIADRVAQFINHGRTDTYGHATVGHNFRMTNIAAAIGLAQLNRLPSFIEQRRANAAALTEALAGTTLRPPTEPDAATHVYHQYTVRAEDRDGLTDHLSDHDIGVGIYYPTCIHNLEAYGNYHWTTPIAEQMTGEVLSLPVHPTITREDIERIGEVIHDYER